MANKDYGLYASVGVYEFPEVNSPTRNYTLDMEAFGIRKGLELTVDEISARGSTMVAMIKAMKRPSPMTLLWQPCKEQQGLFAEIRGKKLRIELSFVRSGNNTPRPDVVSLLTIDNVRIQRIHHDSPIGNGSKAKYERIDAHFSKFDSN